MPSRAERRSGERRPEPVKNKSHLGTYVAIGAVLIVIIAAVAISFLVKGGSSTSDFDQAAHSVQLSGDPLIQYSSSNDSAVGKKAPTLRGTNFDGETVQIVPDGRPTVIMFLAHWCPHCQNEVRWLAPWFTENGVPTDVRIFSVATSIDPAAPNYPPDAWLQGAGWKVPVIVDDKQSTAAAYFGLSAFPYWVVLDGDGSVLYRSSGEIEIDQFEQMIAGLRAS